MLYRDNCFVVSYCSNVLYIPRLEGNQTIYFGFLFKKSEVKVNIRNRYNQLPHLTQDTIWDILILNDLYFTANLAAMIELSSMYFRLSGIRNKTGLNTDPSDTY